jgi:hypothetical protein
MTNTTAPESYTFADGLEVSITRDPFAKTYSFPAAILTLAETDEVIAHFGGAYIRTSGINIIAG